MIAGGPGSRSVAVPAEVLEAHLAALGGRRETQGREVVYDFAPCSHRTIRVLTSIALGEAVSRDVGKDAIRVVAFGATERGTGGIAKTSRVYRTGTVAGVLARIDARLADVRAVVEHRPCPLCASEKKMTTTPKFFGDSPTEDEQISEALYQAKAKEDPMADRKTTKATEAKDEFDAFLDDAGDEAPESGERSAPPRLDLDSLLAGLNPEQRAVVLHDAGPLVVQAVAGSGKTKAVVHRIARLVLSGVPGSKILAVTFSKKAADEMNDRLKKLGITSARVGTWHSLCLQILKEDRTRWASWKVDESDRAKTLLKDAVGYKHLNWRSVDFGALRSFLTICKANLWTWNSPEAKALAGEKFGRDAALALDAFELYQDLVEQAGLLTFDDFLTFVAAHLSVEENAQAWGAKWDYVIVDEYQDNNAAQNFIMGVLAAGTRNLHVVGDVAQSIYGFRGSKPDYLAAFEAKWGAKRVAMVRNYRCGIRVVGTANAVIESAKIRMPESMVAERPEQGSVEVVAATDLDDESSSIARWITRNVAAGAAKLADHTILFRLNAQSRAVEEALLRAKIPYLLVGGVSFYERKEVKDLLGYLRVALGREAPGAAAGDALRRCINAPFRFLGKAFVEKVMRIAGSTNDASWPDIVRQASNEAGIQHRQRASAEEWASLVERVAEMATVAPRQDPESGEVAEREENPSAILNWIVTRTDYIRAIEKEEGSESVESSLGANVRELIRVAYSFPTTAEFLAYVEKTILAAAKQRRDGQAGGDLVLLMSIHRSKGLEFDRLWVVGLNETILPHHKGDPEEEQRLAYVAVTRAKNELKLSWVKQLVTRAGMREGTPSRFLVAAGLVRADGGYEPGDDEVEAEHEARAVEGGAS